MIIASRVSSLTTNLSHHRGASEGGLVSQVLQGVIYLANGRKFVSLGTSLRSLHVYQGLFSNLRGCRVVSGRLLYEGFPFFSFARGGHLKFYRSNRLIGHLLDASLLGSPSRNVGGGSSCGRKIFMKAGRRCRGRRRRIRGVRRYRHVLRGSLLVYPNIKIFIVVCLTLHGSFLGFFIHGSYRTSCLPVLSVTCNSIRLGLTRTPIVVMGGESRCSSSMSSSPS